MRLTPQLMATGVYTLRTPFTASSTTIYKCIALRKFDDIVELGEDVYSEYYSPVGLDQNVYQSDAAAGAVIVTLQDSSGGVIYVPDTYIASYPQSNDVSYSHVILSVSMGPLPDNLDLEYVKQQMSAVASDIIGVDALVKEHVAPTVGIVTPDMHSTLEAARLLRVTNRETDRAKVIANQAHIDSLEEKIRVLEQVIIDAGLLP